MIAEIIAIISAGVVAVEGVTRIIKNMQDISDNRSRNELQGSIENIQGRISSVENELAKQQPDEQQLTEAYSDLINALKQDKNYSSRLKIVPTSYGTWKILRRKSTILRDPRGEY